MAQKQMIVLTGCVSGTVTRGEGSEKPKLLQTSYVNGPFALNFPVLVIAT